MTFSSKSERPESSHVIFTYHDDEDQDQDDHQHSSLLQTSSDVASVSAWRRRTWCCKRLILCLALLTVGIGFFELAFHGKEAESIQAVRDHIGQLGDTVGQRFKKTFGKVMAAAPIAEIEAESSSDEAESDGGAEKVKNNSVILLKTGASVLFDRLPVQLLQAQSVLHPQLYLTGQPSYHGPTFLIYSDAATTLGPFTVHDALSNVSTRVRNNPSFSSRYDQLHHLLSTGELTASSFKEGWNLDKYKFTYMWADAFRRNPHAEWYIGYEADTFVLWTSLFRFLATQDASKEQLFGCGSILTAKQELFANGGCPYVISGALMRATYGKDEKFAERFDDEVDQSCCGDAELSIALRKSATVPIERLGESRARFQGERPREVLFSGDNWCEPVVSFHHLKTEEVHWLAGVERQIRRQKKLNETVLYRDFFDHFLPVQLKNALQALDAPSNSSTKVELNPMKQDWEAFSSSDRGVSPGGRVANSVDCKKQCIESKGCTTWFWIKPTEQDTDGDCYMMHDAIRIGKSYEGTGLRTSGWIGERIASFKAHHACTNPPAA